ncbi:MAG: universal stress protein [Planctomycetota bacterium]|nr:universal stress protein [Planctomycetota bacterium]
MTHTPHTSHAGHPVQYKRLLLPSAFSKLSEAASAWAVPLAKQFHSEVHVLHVVPHTELAMLAGAPELGAGVAAPVVTPSASEMLAASARQVDAFVQRALGEIRDQVRTASVVGGVVDEIIRYVEQRQIDLIVMGTHADGMLKRLVFGSIGKSVLEAAPCPVLLVPIRSLSK